MSFFFRKSVRLGGGARANYSQSGVGFSFGVKGLRVSTGSRGTYINMGIGGIRYRQKVGGPYGQQIPEPTRVPSPPPLQNGTPIPNATVDQMVDSNSNEALERLNSAVQQPAYAWIFIASGVVLGLALAVIHPIIFCGTIVFAIFLAFLAHKFDIERKTYSLEYHFDEATRHRWNDIGTAFQALSKSQSLWRILTMDPNYDWKRNAGASALLNRFRATVAQHPANYISCNLTPYCLNIGNQQMFFFPDRIYIYENGKYGAVEYTGLDIQAGSTRFIENETVPSDAQVVGSTWQYLNKNGTPDRRFNNNRQLPIANYGVIEIRSSIGLNVLLHTSSLNAAHQFNTFFHQNHFSTPNSTSNQQARAQQPQRPTQPTPQPTPTCYQILNLSPNCTKEESATKYWQLAMSYHPDKVNTLPNEFKLLAHQKMSEINNAYAELKRIRGW